MFNCCVCGISETQKLQSPPKVAQKPVISTERTDRRRSIGLHRPEEEVRQKRLSLLSTDEGLESARPTPVEFPPGPERSSIQAQGFAPRPSSGDAAQQAGAQDDGSFSPSSLKMTLSQKPPGSPLAVATDATSTLEPGSKSERSSSSDTSSDDGRGRATATIQMMMWQAQGDEQFGGKAPPSASGAFLPAEPQRQLVIQPLAAPTASRSESSLAARRNLGSIAGRNPLQVSTCASGTGSSTMVASRSVPSAVPRKTKEIRSVSRIADHYDLGAEVMPSCHRGMQILHSIQKSSGQPVVVKVRLKSDIQGNRAQRWLAGAKFMASLPSRCHIAQIYEVLEDPKAYYVVMEKVAGRDLFESVSGQVQLPIMEIKEIMCQILIALSDLHAQGQIHRDLKLENVMLDRTTPLTTASYKSSPAWEKGSGGSGSPRRSSISPRRGSGSPRRKSDAGLSAGPTSPISVKLIDFDTLEHYASETSKLAKDVLGTNQYIAQEAYDGRYSPASDIFAAGVIGYRLLTSRFPFKSEIFDDKPGENRVGSPKMQEIRSKVRNFRIKWSYKVFDEEPGALNLLQSMLAGHELDRPLAKEALQHPWLRRGSVSKDGALAGHSPRPSTARRSGKHRTG